MAAKKKTKSPRYTPDNGWGIEFEDVFEFAVSSKDNGAIIAVAGGGKTTAIVESVKRVLVAKPKTSILVVAFNTTIRDTLLEKLSGWPLEIRTVHQHGFSALRDSGWGGSATAFDVQGSDGEYMMKLAEAQVGSDKDGFADRVAILNLVSMCKTRLASSIDEIKEIITNYGFSSSYTNDNYAQYAKNILEFTKIRPGLTRGPAFGKNSKNIVDKKIVTFDDQVWIPVINNLTVDKFDLVFVDEAQDLSKSRVELIKKSIKPNGRIIACGDPFQAIFSFAGADIDALADLCLSIDANVMPLSCTFRCPKKVVRQAQEINPQIQHSPIALEGEIITISQENILNYVAIGDVILSRTNAPIIKLFFKYAKQKLKVKFIGKDYGNMMAMRIKGWKSKFYYDCLNGNNSGIFNVRKILEYNDFWLENKSKDDKGVSKQVSERFRDEYETVKILCEDLESNPNSEKSYNEIIERCYSFSPEDKDLESLNCIALSSVHRFKGRERDNVFVLVDTFKIGTNQEENNLWYVAVTRAMKKLYFVE